MRLLVPEEKKGSLASLEQNVGMGGGGGQGGHDGTDRDTDGRTKWNNFHLFFTSNVFFFPTSLHQVVLEVI